MRPGFLALLAAVPMTGVAQAAQPPRQPTRDVVVSYRVDGPAVSLIPGGLPGPVRLSWDAARRRVRAEADGRSQIAIIGLASRAGQLIDMNLRIAIPFHVRAKDLQPLTLANAQLEPVGRQTVAGLQCTNYRVEAEGGPGSVCLTDDGVPLAGGGEVEGKAGRFTAISVEYGKLPPDLFMAPPGIIDLGGATGPKPAP